ncbi:MAG TPA: cytochrome c [Acidimicrobiia bacterium]|nr:cytochrome c [Acidimicrobiia bacterium]
MVSSIKSIGVILASVAIISACAPDGGSDSAAPLEQQRLARGGELYQKHCASCHQTDLSGDPEWRTPNDDGSYPPPPHDSSGHTWHHSDQVLLEIIRNGSDFPQSKMPSYGDKLSDDDIGAILEFFKANWGPEEREYQQRVNEQQTQARGMRHVRISGAALRSVEAGMLFPGNARNALFGARF